MAASSGTSWAQLRQQARSLETQTETLFHSYSQHASLATLPSSPSTDELRLESQLSDLLSRREALLSQLSRLLDSESALTSSALKQTNLARHREILADHRRELARLKGNIASARDRSNLLSSVRSDIRNYRDGEGGGGGGGVGRRGEGEGQEAEYMVDERARLDRSHGVIDGVLSQAYAVQENFASQRDILASVNRRIVGAASQVPGINGLIGKIGAKRRRDGIIMGGFIAFCFLMLLYFR